MGRWLDEEISVPHEGGNSDVMGGHRDSMEDQEEDDGEDDEANG